MIFDLVDDFNAVLEAMPDAHPQRRFLKLLDEAIRRDVQFINRHPTTLFQCMWNTCWWYDSPEAAKHYEEPEDGWQEPPPWQREGEKLCERLEEWKEQKEEQTPGFRWLRSLRPPPVHLGTAQQAMLPHPSVVNSVAFSPDGRRIASGSQDKTVRGWDAAGGECLQMIEGSGDVAAIAGGEKAYPLRAMMRGQETVIDDARTGEPVVRFPQELTEIITYPSGRRWAGVVFLKSHLYLLQLEGDVDSLTKSQGPT